MNEDLISISSGTLTAAINPLGAELWSLQDAEGRELMTDADPAFWTGHAPILFPIVGRLRNDEYRYDGHSFTMGQHGFARRMIFALIEHEADSLTFRREPNAETLGIYPFDFRLEMGFRVGGSTLHMTATVQNRGERPMPFSLGFHPAFAWPLPYGASAEAHRIIFQRPEPAMIRRIGSEPGLISLERFPSPVAGDMLAPTHAMFERDALIWDDLASRSLTWGAPMTPSLRIDFPDTPWLGIWQKPGAHYLCIEPWAGMADPEDFDGEIWDKPGIMALEPGDARGFRLDITRLP